jgi:hypothetical protein
MISAKVFERSRANSNKNLTEAYYCEGSSRVFFARPNLNQTPTNESYEIGIVQPSRQYRTHYPPNVRLVLRSASGVENKTGGNQQRSHLPV